MKIVTFLYDFHKQNAMVVAFSRVLGGYPFSFAQSAFSYKAMIRYLVRNRKGWAESAMGVYSQSKS